MKNPISHLFDDEPFVNLVQGVLPKLFQIAEIESSRAGKIGMEVGNLRERIIVSLFLHVFNPDEVETEIPTTEPEVDVIIREVPISIKTITGKSFSGIKLIWTVDPIKAKEFQQNYQPSCDILLIQIDWKNENGGMYYFPLNAQIDIMDEIGREEYIKLPKEGTNPRGVELHKNTVNLLIAHSLSKSINIIWKKENLNYDPYSKWLDQWKENL